MYAVEFQAKIKDGNIEVPDEFKERFQNEVRVILLANEKRTQGDNLIDQLLANPLYIAGFHPLQRDAIYAR